MPDTTLKGILDTYTTLAIIPEIEDAREFEGNAPEGTTVMALARGLTYKLEQVDREARSGGKYNQRGVMSGDIFTITVYAMSDGTDNAETIIQAELADLIAAVDTFNAFMLNTYDYTHLLLPNLKDITIQGEKDYKTAKFTILASKSTKENY